MENAVPCFPVIITDNRFAVKLPENLPDIGTVSAFLYN